MVQVERDQTSSRLSWEGADQAILELRKMFLSKNRRKRRLFEQIAGSFASRHD